MTSRFSWKKNISGHDPQGTWRQDEMIGGKPPVVKQFWLRLWESRIGEMSQSWDIRHSVRTLAEDIVGIRYQERTSEYIEDFMCGAVTVIFRVCKPVRLLQLLVFTGCMYKWSINRVTNPNPVYSHTQNRDNNNNNPRKVGPGKNLQIQDLLFLSSPRTYYRKLSVYSSKGL
jgi:hypothetical protein